jgi:hypothetical protein
MMISCGDDRGDNELWGAGFAGGAGFVEIDPEGLWVAGGRGLAAATGAGVFVAGDWAAGFFAIVRGMAGGQETGWGTTVLDVLAD